MAAAPEVPVPLDHRRLFTAFVLTPMLAGFYPALFRADPALLPVGLLLAYGSGLVCGVPLVILFARRGLRDWRLFMGGGAICALPAVALWAFNQPAGQLKMLSFPVMLEVLAWGAVCGIVFWMVGVAGESVVSIATLFDPLEMRRKR
ncbi:MAG: hypothetical protein JOY91_17910 [Sinobacteraceae bacterium]|nr:hypothetical protein [Nevskiaceae bacterium]